MRTINNAYLISGYCMHTPLNYLQITIYLADMSCPVAAAAFLQCALAVIHNLLPVLCNVIRLTDVICTRRKMGPIIMLDRRFAIQHGTCSGNGKRASGGQKKKPKTANPISYISHKLLCQHLQDC